MKKDMKTAILRFALPAFLFLGGRVAAVPYAGTLEICRRGFVRTTPGTFAACAAKDRALDVLYFYNRTRTTGTLKGLSPDTRYTATWFNPRTGECAPSFPLAGAELPPKPDDQDWVLKVVR